MHCHIGSQILIRQDLSLQQTRFREACGMAGDLLFHSGSAQSWRGFGIRYTKTTSRLQLMFMLKNHRGGQSKCRAFRL
ncbi:hypothetical protein PO124_32380 [Bacillus licheniformis]|nr:hypothetical protein [Bacillus licheniformis]